MIHWQVDFEALIEKLSFSYEYAYPILQDEPLMSELHEEIDVLTIATRAETCSILQQFSSDRMQNNLRDPESPFVVAGNYIDRMDQLITAFELLLYTKAASAPERIGLKKLTKEEAQEKLALVRQLSSLS